MKVLFRCFLLFISVSSFAQQTPYQSFEVDSVASPHGGIASLNTFIQANLRKPIAAQAEGIGGRIIVSAVVEPDGSTSNVKLVSRLRPDCDREALRVFKLFKAWKPAQKDGKAVRQQITAPVLVEPNAPFTYWNGTIITYLNDNNQASTNVSNVVAFKEVVPVDTNGLPNGDRIVYKLNGKTWEEHYRDRLLRRRTQRVSPLGHPVYQVGYKSAVQDGLGSIYTIDKEGNLLEKVTYKNNRPADTHLFYHANGIIAEKRDYSGTGQLVFSWYDTGQIKSVQEIMTAGPSHELISNQCIGLWDSTGRQLVKNGNGWAVFSQTVKSRKEPAKQISYTEQGAYENSVKQGKWTGQYADNSYQYEEQYSKGIFQSGKSWTANADTVHYNQLEDDPRFEGGLVGLQDFLNANLRYPVSAQRDRAQGKVFVSFVVCEDGSLCDYDIVKGLHPDLDQEALRVVEKMSGHWQPGIQRGQKSRTKYNIPISFSLL